MGIEKPAIGLSVGVRKHGPGDEMGEYEDTIKDIEETFGIVPGFMKALPQEVLIHDWPLWKKYSLEQSAIPGKYRELGGLAVAARIAPGRCHHAFTDGAGAGGV